MKNTVSLKKNYQFMRVYKKGISFVGKYLIAYSLNNYSDVIRLGITTSRKVGNSVVRNRLRRLIKENYRSLEDEISIGFDIVFVVRANENIPNYYEIKKEMRYLLRKLSLLENVTNS